MDRVTIGPLTFIERGGSLRVRYNFIESSDGYAMWPDEMDEIIALLKWYREHETLDGMSPKTA